MYALLVQHVYSVFCQHTVWYCPTSEIVWMQKMQKNSLIYAYFAELMKITSKIYLDSSSFFNFSSPSNFIAVCFV